VQVTCIETRPIVCRKAIQRVTDVTDTHEFKKMHTHVHAHMRTHMYTQKNATLFIRSHMYTMTHVPCEHITHLNIYTYIYIYVPTYIYI